MTGDTSREGAVEKIAAAMIENLDVPDSEVRQILLRLAAIADDPATPALDLVIAQVGYLAMAKEMRSCYEKKSPLQEQAEFLRLRRELKESSGVEIRDPYKT